MRSPFSLFTISGLTHSLTLMMIIITESIDASVGAAFFYQGFSFLSLSLFGVVSTRKFPIARENSQVFYVFLRFLLCVGTPDFLLSTYNYVILELLRCEDKKGSVSLVVAATAIEMSIDREWGSFKKGWPSFPIRETEMNWKSVFPQLKAKDVRPTLAAEPLTQLTNFKLLRLFLIQIQTAIRHVFFSISHCLTPVA